MNHRKLAVFVGALLVLIVFGAVAFVFITRNDGSNVITRTIGRGNSGDPNTLAIYAPSELSKPLERVTTAFQQEHPGTTFQFTLGPSGELSQRIRSGQLPNLYIDTSSAVAPIAKARAKAPPVAFGYDMIQLVVPKGNPKQVRGLDAFGAGSAFNTGMCAQQEFCGAAAAYALKAAGVTAAPKVVTNNVGDLTDGVKTGRIDAVLLPRTDVRSVLTNITNIPLQQDFRIDYQMAQLKKGGPSDQFIQWVQTSPNARQALRFAGMLSFYDV